MAATSRTWQEQAMEARVKEELLVSLGNKFREIYLATKDLPDTSEAELAKAKAKEERSALMREFLRVGSEIKTSDYSGMTEAERAAEAERLRQEAMEKARSLEMAGDTFGCLREQGMAGIIHFDSKEDGMYFNRVSLNLATFDHDEESPFGPMRFTHKVYENVRPQFCNAVNFLSVKIACSDVGFPIQVYGSVIARDSIDLKCLYLFRRDRDHCQLITSEDEPLILTGPKRGHALLDDTYVEADLKIKDHQGQDRELSKGILTIRGSRTFWNCKVERGSIATRLSTVDVRYAVVLNAVEGTIAIRVLQGRFYGTITAYTTSVQERIVLYDSKVASSRNKQTKDSKVAGAKTPDGHGVIQLMRSVVSVYVRDMLIIDAETSAGESVRLELTPRVNGGKRNVVTLGATKMRVKIAWSMMDP